MVAFERIRHSLFVISISIVLIILTASPVLAASPMHKVTGGGTADWPGGLATYGFTARQLDDLGNAKGKAHVQVRDESEVTGLLEIDILYLAVKTETGDAWMGGVITKATPSSFVGVEVIWRVQDNGEGKNASSPDMTSTIIGPPAIRALEMPDIPLRQIWTNGNISVH
ncbi:hypothetical protein ACFLW8_06320 [Chloroflexota bacterium]